MTNTIDSDNVIGISDFVDHTIVADAYPPIVFATGKLCGQFDREVTGTACEDLFQHRVQEKLQTRALRSARYSSSGR